MIVEPPCKEPPRKLLITARAIPVIEKGHRPNATLNRGGEGAKLGGSTTPNSTDVLDVHGAPTTLQEG